MKVSEILENNFNAFTNDVKSIVPQAEALFKLMIEDDNIDQLEVMETMLFLVPDDRYTFHLDQLLDFKGISLEIDQKEKLIPIIERYVTLLRKLKAHLNN